jgi:arabinogalactan endo-1,4-beta-galactosidase
VPKSWRGLTGPALEDRVGRYTAEVLDALADGGVRPAMVQVGNEITNGMLWPHGEVPHYRAEERRFADTDPAVRSASYDRLARLLSRGAAAVRAHAPAAAVLLHLDLGGAADLYRAWFDEIVARGVDFDVIGLSYYPYWHGTLADLAANLAAVTSRYGRDALVVETAYPHRPDSPRGSACVVGATEAERVGFPATVAGQGEFLRALDRVLAAVPRGRGLGFVYWEPAWLPVGGTSWASRAGMDYGDDVAEPGNPWANQALFDERGEALTSWDAFR